MRWYIIARVQLAPRSSGVKISEYSIVGDNSRSEDMEIGQEAICGSWGQTLDRY